jgi:hypothetical protein
MCMWTQVQYYGPSFVKAFPLVFSTPCDHAVEVLSKPDIVKRIRISPKMTFGSSIRSDHTETASEGFAARCALR